MSLQMKNEEVELQLWIRIENMPVIVHSLF